MSDIENGKRNVSLDVIKRVADKLDIHMSDLFQKVEEIG
jgi:transcriptional regulator with XRE-family HTH domain